MFSRGLHDSSASPLPLGRGRGRGAILPAWMTNPELACEAQSCAGAGRQTHSSGPTPHTSTENSVTASTLPAARSRFDQGPKLMPLSCETPVKNNEAHGLQRSKRSCSSEMEASSRSPSLRKEKDRESVVSASSPRPHHDIASERQEKDSSPHFCNDAAKDYRTRSSSSTGSSKKPLVSNSNFSSDIAERSFSGKPTADVRHHSYSSEKRAMHKRDSHSPERHALRMNELESRRARASPGPEPLKPVNDSWRNGRVKTDEHEKTESLRRRDSRSGSCTRRDARKRTFRSPRDRRSEHLSRRYPRSPSTGRRPDTSSVEDNVDRKRRLDYSDAKRLRHPLDDRDRDYSYRRSPVSDDSSAGRSRRRSLSKEKNVSCRSLCVRLNNIRNTRSFSRRQHLIDSFARYIDANVGLSGITEFVFEDAHGHRSSWRSFKEKVLLCEDPRRSTIDVTRRISLEKDATVSYCFEAESYSSSDAKHPASAEPQHRHGIIAFYECRDNKLTRCFLFNGTAEKVTIYDAYKFSYSYDISSPLRKDVTLEVIQQLKVWSIVSRYLLKKGVSSSALCTFDDTVTGVTQKGVLTLKKE